MCAAPYMKIVEQPAGTSFRFRYESEGRFGGCIQGIDSTAEKPSFPRIKIGNYTGKVIVLVSCVTQRKPYKQHPHKISSKNAVDGGFYRVEKTIYQSGEIEFNDIGVISVKKNAIYESLKARKNEGVDPTSGGWNHINNPQLMDLQSVRLCFQVQMLSADGSIRTPLGYEVSNAVMDKRSNGQPKIAEISSTTSSVMGGERIILLCDKVKREDISIVFYEYDDGGKEIWREEINYQNQSGLRVHHQYGISFLTPTYKELDIRQPRQTLLQLFRPSDKKKSEPLDFEFTPNEQSNVSMIRKKHKKVSKSLKETLVTDSSHSRKREAKPKKIKHEPSIEDRLNVLLESNRKNTVVHRNNPQPLINLDENGEENVQIPYTMNNQRQNIYQATTGNAVASDYGQFAGTSGRHNDYPAYCYVQNHNGSIDRQHIPNHTRPLNVPTAYQPQIQEQQPIPAPIYPNIFTADSYAMHSNRSVIPNADHSMNSAMNPSASYMYHLPYNNDMTMPEKPSELYLDIERATNIHSETNGMNLSELAQKNSADLMKIFDTEGFIEDTFCDAFRMSIELSKQTAES